MNLDLDEYLVLRLEMLKRGETPSDALINWYHPWIYASSLFAYRVPSNPLRTYMEIPSPPPMPQVPNRTEKKRKPPPSEEMRTQKRTRHSKEDTQILEESFQRNKLPSPEEKQRLVDETNLSLKQVDIWFTNRRRRPKD